MSTATRTRNSVTSSRDTGADTPDTADTMPKGLGIPARLRAEAVLLHRRFPDLLAGHDPEHGWDWVYIPTFDLPPGWNRRRCALLILVPPGYPYEPPRSFFLERGLRDEANRGIATHYFESEEGASASTLNPYADRNWAWYCYHVAPGAWWPTSSPTIGDSLLTYANVIYQVLAGEAPCSVSPSRPEREWPMPY